MKPRLVVIGNGMAGMRTIEELLTVAPERYQITVFGAEPFGNYNRIMLSAILSGEKSIDDIIIHDRQWYANHKIQLYTGAEKAIVHIDRHHRQVIAQDGTVADYDYLIISTGSKAIMPQVPGHHLQGVISFRDVVDVNTMLDYASRTKKAVVLGGGLLGLEAANGLASRGMEVTVIHNHATLLNRQLDEYAAQLLQDQLYKRNIQFKLATQLQALLGDINGHIQAVKCEDGKQLDCDLFVAAIGVRPNINLAIASGLTYDRGIIVNDTLQTNDPIIYAVGECIQHRGQTFGLVAPLFEQAKVCAHHLSGHCAAQYITLPTATKLKVTGIHLFSIGDFQGDHETEYLYYKDPGLGIYKKLVLKKDRLVGAVLYGDTQDGPWYQELLETGQPLTTLRPSLIFGKVYAQ